MLKKILAGGVIADLGFVMATNAYANTVIPLTTTPELSNHLQIMAGVSGILICLSRVIKTMAEAYFIKRKADLLDSKEESE